MKEFSLVLIILSSATIVVSQILSLIGNNVLGQRIFGVAIILLGIGLIMLGAYTLQYKNKQS